MSPTRFHPALLWLALATLTLPALSGCPGVQPNPEPALPMSEPGGDPGDGDTEGDGAATEAARAARRKLAASPDHADADLPPPDPDQGAFTVVTDEPKSDFGFAAVTLGGENVTGRFRRVIGGLYLAGSDLSKTTGTLSVDLREIDSGDVARDAHLSQAFFEVLDVGSPLGHLEIKAMRIQKPQLAPGETSAVEIAYGLGLPQGAIEGRAGGHLRRLDSDGWELKLSGIKMSISAVGMTKQNDKLARAWGGPSLADLIEFRGTILLMSRPSN